MNLKSYGNGGNYFYVPASCTVLCTFQISVDFYCVPVGGRGGGRGGWRGGGRGGPGVGGGGLEGGG
jgi:hypothetical protein